MMRRRNHLLRAAERERLQAGGTTLDMFEQELAAKMKTLGADSKTAKYEAGKSGVRTKTRGNADAYDKGIRRLVKRIRY